MKRGKYELERRAERQEETRVILELHETVGPSLTTIRASAERVGVGRPTVYSHFPDKLSLFKACSSPDSKTRRILARRLRLDTRRR